MRNEPLLEKLIGALVSIAHLDEALEDAGSLLDPAHRGQHSTLAAARSHLERSALEVHSLLQRHIEPPPEATQRAEGPH